jgi:hypothetical protein
MSRTRTVLVGLLAISALALSVRALWPSAPAMPEAKAAGNLQQQTEAEDSATARTAEAKVPAEVGSPATVTPASRTARAQPGIIAATASVPLPAHDVPLAEILDELRRRADAGDARAACRIAAELRRCELVGVQLSVAQRMEAQRPQVQKAMGDQTDPNTQDYFKRMDRFNQSALDASTHCAGVTASDPKEQIRYWRQAALAGHLRSMSMYASGDVFRIRNSLAMLPELEIFRHEAEGMAQRAAQAGDAEALLALTRAYAPAEEEMFVDLIAQATGPNVVEELANLLLAHSRGLAPRSGPRDGWRGKPATMEELIAEARTRADATQILKAEQLAAERGAQLPARIVPPVEDGQRRHFLDDDQRDRCDSEVFAPVAATAASG